MRGETEFVTLQTFLPALTMVIGGRPYSYLPVCEEGYGLATQPAAKVGRPWPPQEVPTLSLLLPRSFRVRPTRGFEWPSGKDGLAPSPLQLAPRPGPKDFAEGVPDVHQPTLERLVDRSCRPPAGPGARSPAPPTRARQHLSNARVEPSRTFGCSATECRAWTVMARTLLRRTFSSILALPPTIYISASSSSRLLFTTI